MNRCPTFQVVPYNCSGSPANAYDICLHQLMAAHGWSRTSGPEWDSAPLAPGNALDFQNPAPGSRPFREVTTIARPVVAGVDTALATFRVPPGYDALLLTITCLWVDAVPPTPLTFQNGSGELTWRVQVNGRYFLKNLGAIQTERGDLSQPYPLEGGGYRIPENDTVSMVVSLSAAALGSLDPNGRITGGLSGWFYPKGGRRR